MIKMSMKLNGREVRPEDFARELTKDIERRSKALIAQKIEDCVCPVHGTHAKAVPSADRPGQWTYSTTFCCEDHKNAAVAQLGGRNA